MKVLGYCYAGVVMVAVLFALGLWNPFAEEATAKKPKNAKAPTFKVVPDWPKRLPNNWLMGQVAGIAVDRHDTIWVVQRPRSLTSDEAGGTRATVDTDDDGIADADVYGHPRPAGPRSDCCVPAPSVLQFDKKGNLLQAWGGPAAHDPEWQWLRSEGNGFAKVEFACNPPECQWPANEHGIFVDHNDFVYIGGNGFGSGSLAGGSNSRGWDGMILKFASDGDFIMQVGAAGCDATTTPACPASNDTNGALNGNGTPQLWRPADSEVDPETNELYVSDGYGNHRIVVVDADTGLYLRHWGAYGQKPVNDAGSDAMGSPTNPAPGTDPELDAPPHFRNPVHAVRISKDGLAYVADRPNNRLQVFDKTIAGTADCTPAGPGTCGFLAEKFVERDTLGPGSVWDLDTSRDKPETFLFNPDGTNQYVWTLHRATLDILARFGGNGRNAGQFHWVHNLALDSKGNMYTAEVDTGKRAQKFKCKGKGCK